MENTLLQIGAGGAFAIMALREVRGILVEFNAKRKNGNGNGHGPVLRVGDQETSGEKAPEYWIEAYRKSAMEAAETMIMPVLRQQTEILEKIAEEQRRISDGMLLMTAAKQARGAKR